MQKLDEAVDIATDKLNRRAADKWRIDRTISPSMIAAVVAFIVTGTLAYSDLKSTDNLLKADNANLHALFNHMETSEQETLAKISEQYKSLNDKVDRLIERQMK
jgi:adenylate cyclase